MKIYIVLIIPTMSILDDPSFLWKVKFHVKTPSFLHDKTGASCENFLLYDFSPLNT